jgi:hypothetical protein
MIFIFEDSMSKVYYSINVWRGTLGSAADMGIPKPECVT